MGILIVDDNIEILDILSYHLIKKGYELHLAQSAEKALQILNTCDIDLAILDVMMPVLDGYELCRTIRQKHFFPILFLTAKANESDKVQGFMSGADDYMLKPFSAVELLARVSSLLRRTTVYNPKTTPMRYKVNQLILDELSGVVKFRDEIIDLTDIEYKLLQLLLKNRGKSLTIEFIFHEIWGGPFMRTSRNTVVVHVRNIRRKLAQYAKETKYIHTIWGKGYAIY